VIKVSYEHVSGTHKHALVVSGARRPADAVKATSDHQFMPSDNRGFVSFCFRHPQGHTDGFNRQEGILM